MERRATHRTPDAATLVLLISSALFILLTALVLLGATQTVDSAVLDRLRPGDAWNDAQVRWVPWMTRLDPQHMFVLLGATSVVVSLWRRSAWPLVSSLVLAAGSTVATVATKLAGHRPDPHGFVTETGGAYPSGHTVALIVCLGGCVLVIWPRVAWWLWTPVVAGAAVLATSLLVCGAHWATDVLGGLLLGVALLAGGTRLRLLQWGSEDHEGPARPHRWSGTRSAGS